MTAAFIDRTINGNHTFACALTTRGGVCDCWPEHGGSTVSTPPMADSLESAVKGDRTAEAADEAQRGLRDG